MIASQRAFYLGSSRRRVHLPRPLSTAPLFRRSFHCPQCPIVSLLSLLSVFSLSSPVQLSFSHLLPCLFSIPPPLAWCPFVCAFSLGRRPAVCLLLPRPLCQCRPPTVQQIAQGANARHSIATLPCRIHMNLFFAGERSRARPMKMCECSPGAIVATSRPTGAEVAVTPS